MDNQIKLALFVATTDALARGTSRAGTFRVAVTDEWLAQLTEQERAALVPFTRAGGKHLAVTEPTLEAARTAIRADLAKKRAELDEIVAKHLDAPDEDLITPKYSGGPGYKPRSAITEIQHHAPDLYARAEAAAEAATKRLAVEKEQEILDKIVKFETGPDEDLLTGRLEVLRGVVDLKDRAPDLYARAQAAAEKAQAARDAEVAAREARIAEERYSWLVEHGTDSLREREDEGLLPDAELKAAIRDWIFAPLADIPEYEDIDTDDVEHHDEGRYDECECDVNTDAKEAKELDEDAFNALKAFRALFAKLSVDAEHTCFRNRAWPDCEPDDDSCTITRYSVLVEVTYAGYALEREYALEG